MGREVGEGGGALDIVLALGIGPGVAAAARGRCCRCGGPRRRSGCCVPLRRRRGRMMLPPGTAGSFSAAHAQRWAPVVTSGRIPDCALRGKICPLRVQHVRAAAASGQRIRGTAERVPGSAELPGRGTKRQGARNAPSVRQKSKTLKLRVSSGDKKWRKMHGQEKKTAYLQCSSF